MDSYTIRKAYHWTSDDEIEIESENLIYCELGSTHSGCQTNNLDNNDKIHEKCIQISNLIREIEEMQK